MKKNSTGEVYMQLLEPPQSLYPSEILKELGVAGKGKRLTEKGSLDTLCKEEGVILRKHWG